MVTEVVEAPIVDVLVLVTDLVTVLVEAARVVVLVAAAVATLVLVVTTSINTPQVTAVAYSVGEQVALPLVILHATPVAARAAGRAPCPRGMNGLDRFLATYPLSEARGVKPDTVGTV